MPRIVVIISIVTVIFVIYNVFNLASSEFLVDVDFAAFIVTVAYPILDLILIIPSAIILVCLHRDYQHPVPWFLSSLSLLVNAVADDGYVSDFVNANSQNMWVWRSLLCYRLYYYGRCIILVQQISYFK